MSNRNDRLVQLVDGTWTTFTQRGSDPTWGFVRVKGKTISGYRSSGIGIRFYAWSDGKNAEGLTFFNEKLSLSDERPNA